MALSKVSTVKWTDTETLSSEEQGRPLTRTERIIAEAGSKLLSVVPIMFPERMMMKAFKEERDEARRAQLTRFWRDNGPEALRRAMKLCTLSMGVCKCRTCTPAHYHCRAVCVFFERVISFAKSSDLTVCVMCADENTSPELLRSLLDGDYKEMHNPYWPKPEGFDCKTACRYMKPVSHIPVDIVFQRIKHHLFIAYGSTLWEVGSLSDPKIKQLDLFFASLHR